MASGNNLEWLVKLKNILSTFSQKYFSFIKFFSLLPAIKLGQKTVKLHTHIQRKKKSFSLKGLLIYKNKYIK